MKKIILASNNAHKIKEIKNILMDLNVDIKSLKDENIEIDVVEDGLTFKENAKKKASEISDFLKRRGDSNFIVMSDDSGLEVDYLNGAPGVYSARYAGEHGNDKKNNEKLLKELENVKAEDRTARFVCEIALVDSNSNYMSVRGEARGVILEENKGHDGFGYDPLFYYEPLEMTFAEMSEEDKNKVSHRANALKELKNKIKEIL